MDMSEGDVQHSEEQLKNTLHSDDKEKLRRKLAQLQKEYLKTAQRLQRAERLEAVRRHVRSRISQQRHQEQTEAEVTSNSSSSIKNNNNAMVQGLLQRQGHTESPADTFDLSRRNQVIRFRLPLDAASPQTPDPGNDAAAGHRPSSTLRLRSRRSRLRLERRRAEACGSTDGNPQEHVGRMDNAETVVEKEGRVESKWGDEVNISEELLLTHCTQGPTETGDILGKENQGQQEKEADLSPEERGGNVRVGCKEIEEKEVFKGDVMENGEKSIAKIIKSGGNLVKINEEKNGITREGKAEGLLDSCTIIEGLLFPAEYYVRTTRRMTLSQSQPDMQAVILSQLSTGRQRRSRGRGRGRRGASHSSDQHTQIGFSSPMTPSSFTDPLNSPRVWAADASADCSLIPNPIQAAQVDSETYDSSPITRPPRGRGRRRGRGRGRGRPRTLEEQQPRSASGSSSLIVHGGNTCLSLVEFDSESGATQPPSELNGAAEHLETVHPRGTSSWKSLLLPSSSSPAQTSHLPPPSLFPVPLVSSLKSSDVHQDFHLPDDQFASMKLLKLRQVAVESGVEGFSTPPSNAGSSIDDPAVLLPLPLSFTPTMPYPPCPDDREQQIRLQNFSTEHNLTDEMIGIDSPEKVPENKNAESKVERQQLHAETGDHDDCGQTQFCGLTSSLEDQTTRNHEVENRSATGTLLSDHSQNESQEKPTSLQACNETKAAQELPKTEQRSLAEPSEANSNFSRDRLIQNKTRCGPRGSQLVLKSPPASVSCSFITPHPSSPAAASSPLLPSLGVTPLTASPAAPPLSLPPLHSPASQTLSPPALSPYPSIPRLPPSLPPLSPGRHTQASFKPAVSDQCHNVQPAACPNISSDSPEVQAAEETTDRCIVRHTHTLKAAAGGSLVDACCLSGSSGGLFVAAAGTWAVCLWSQTSASDWSLKHTWTFKEPVINVFPVPDAADLVCVTLGQLEIREVRTLSCLSLTEMLLCEGIMQVVVGLYKSRVVSSSHSATGSTLQVFTLSDSSSSLSCQPLVSPGVCVGALAPVDELCDALIGTDEGGHLFVWNLNTGQLLCTVLLGHGLSNMACLRGYSHCGVLLVLLQRQFLSSLDEEERKDQIKDQMFSEETNTALFSLVGINPLSGKSVLGARLYPPVAWSGRLCEADVHHSSVVGLSQSGCVCVWELGKPTSRQVEAPEGEDWQLARWAGEDTLLIGHHNGDVSLLHY